MPQMRFISVFRGLPRRSSTKTGTPCLVGREVDRYWHQEPANYVDSGIARASKRKIDLMSREKLVGQRIVAHIMHPVDHIDLRITLERAGLLTFETVENFVLTQTEYSAATVLAILNSALINWYTYRFVFNKAIRGMDLDQCYVQKLPSPDICFITDGPKRSQLLEAGKSLFDAALARGQTHDDQAKYSAFAESELGSWANARLHAQPNEGDVVHDLLGHLAIRMIEMTKQQRAEAKAFLAWLAEYTGVPLGDWSLRTRAQSYWEHGWDEFQRSLRRNCKAIEKASGLNVESESTLNAIQSKFDESMARLQPLLHRIASTDRLIDLIVYQLYGLTEEEVAIVEGSR